MKVYKKVFSLLLAVLIVASFAAFTSAQESATTPAALVVYGKIFTSEGNKIVEAFAVKDGKYIYVGDKKGAEAFIDNGKTEVVDYTDKGLVMPGCGNGHAHYMLGYALKTIGTTITFEETPDKFLKETVPAAVKNAKDKGATSVFGQGWNFMRFKDNLPTRQQLNAICSDIPMYFLDDECHKALVNSFLLVKAGIMKEDGTVLKSEIRGGEIGIGEDGTPNGYLSEQAQTYMRSFLDNDNLYTLDMAISNVAEVETGTGFVDPLYPGERQGIPNWTEEEITELTRKANENGLTMHIHVMGNKGVNCVVSAFVNGGKDDMRNTLIHVRNVNEPDYKRMADHNIYVAGSMLWHHNTDEVQKLLGELLRL